MTERILNDRYALAQKVGEGGMAVTYRARDLLLNRTVAVKMMREQFTTDPQFVERFRREAQSAAQLSHEHIAGVYDTGRADGAYYIVMEFVEGTDLKQRLRRDGPLSIPMTLEIGRQIAAALEAAHRSGLVHRDIKPHNVLLNADGKVKVTDFGIAKLATDGEDTGVIIGSVHYLSPEQARGEHTTPASDLYSLGAVLFEMLTGRTVFEGENAMAVAHKHIYEPPPLPRTLRADIPPALETLVLRCLEKDPRARYQSAAEVGAALAQLSNELAQDATMVIPAVPSMDATMVYRKPASETATEHVPQPMVTPARTLPEPPQGGGAGGWLIAVLFVVLLGVVGFGAYQVMGVDRGKDRDLIRPATQVRVPELAGLTEAQAQQQLQRLLLEGEVLAEASDTATKGEIIRQEPPPGRMVDEGARIRVWVCDGPKTITIPEEILGMSLDPAKSQLRQLGYAKDFVIKSEASDEVPARKVARTEPVPGTTISRDAKIVLVLSTGPTIAPAEPVVIEKYNPGSAPDIGDNDKVFVKIERERPAGSEPETILSGLYTPGDKLPVQHIERYKDETIVVRVLAGSDEASATVQSEETLPTR